jgi:hypothetical protein
MKPKISLRVWTFPLHGRTHSHALPRKPAKHADPDGGWFYSNFDETESPSLPPEVAD